MFVFVLGEVEVWFSHRVSMFMCTSTALMEKWMVGFREFVRSAFWMAKMTGIYSVIPYVSLRGKMRSISAVLELGDMDAAWVEAGRRKGVQ